MTCLDSFLKCKTPSALESAVDYLKKKGRLELWSGVVGIKSLERSNREIAMNREAESAFVRRKVWGAGGDGADAMHDTYLGDVTHHVHQQTTGSGGMLKALLGAGLLATGVGVPAGAWMIADAIKGQAPPVVAPSPPTVDTDTLFRLRLGKPEDVPE
jgi:hypothetical protein